MKSGEARKHFNLHDTFNAGGYTLEIIGFDHEALNTITVMAKELLPARRMHSGSCERGWIDTELRKWLNTDFIKKLPADLVSHIVEVEKITHNFKGDSYSTVDKLFIPSESELFGSAIWSDYEDGRRYEAFATCNDRIRLDEDGDGRAYWSRSFVGGNSTTCAHVYYHGDADINSASHTGIRAPLCFCFA